MKEKLNCIDETFVPEILGGWPLKVKLGKEMLIGGYYLSVLNCLDLVTNMR